jgi:hypothetical protein
MTEERHQAWQQRRLYYECSYCGYAETLPLTEGTRGEIRDCDRCGHEKTVGPARHWLRPPGFAHPVDRPEGTTPDDQPVQSYATRAKLIAPSPANPDDWVNITNRVRLHQMRKRLLVTNRGPNQDGYTYCTTCGRIEPTTTINGTIATAHRKPYPDEREPDCSGERTTKNLMLGTDFITDVLLISIVAESPVTLAPGLLATNVALRTIAEALTKAGSDLLNLEPRELQAEYRPSMTEAGRNGREAEIYIYDTLPGGAGFVRRVGDLGRTVFDTALQLLENCPGDCRRSCYRCLQSYKNKFEHDLLDRHLGAGLLRYILNNEYPVLDSDRLDRATDLLFKDLKRQEPPQLTTIEKNYNLSPQGLGPVTAPIYLRRKDGAEFVVGVSGPLTPDDTENEALQDLKEYCPSISVLLCDEIVIQRNLPKASGDVLSRIS